MITRVWSTLLSRSKKMGSIFSRNSNEKTTQDSIKPFENDPNFYLQKGVHYNRNTNEMVTCLFCRIQKREEPGTIVYEDEEFVVFKTIAPATEFGHLLITPREHIANVSSLYERPNSHELVYKMQEIGKKIYEPRNITDILFCFHISPFNSIDHLHLHAIANPQDMDRWSSMKYTTGTIYCRTADDIIERLKANAGVA